MAAGDDEVHDPEALIGLLGQQMREVAHAAAGGERQTRQLTNVLIDLRDMLLAAAVAERRTAHPNPLARAGAKCFSQSDEDGITLEILRRLGFDRPGVFAEYGVGNGLENNTLILAALGWSGLWIGNEPLAFSCDGIPADRLCFRQAQITRDNILDLTRQGLSRLGRDAPDVISCDLDGNDLHFVARLLEGGLEPALFIVEYNAKFPPPVRFSIAYNDDHRWKVDDHFGASLCSFVDLFAAHGYMLACCNAHAGTNAFFVAERYRDRFDDVPGAIADIYVGPHLHMFTRHGMRTSPETVRRLFGADGSDTAG